MNIVEIKTGQYYDPEYSEYHFKTNHPKRDIYDENFNLTNEFQKWLAENYQNVYKSYITDRDNFEIDYLHIDDMDLIP
jgi:hypothetical protein